MTDLFKQPKISSIEMQSRGEMNNKFFLKKILVNLQLACSQDFTQSNGFPASAAVSQTRCDRNKKYYIKWSGLLAVSEHILVICT